MGAGPGDGGLLTLKGLAVLEEADTVVYDALVGDEVLARIPSRAKCINVGKRAGNHTMPQEEINALLLKEAQEGSRVVRLKGGDPFLFGRGGEELELLAEHGIPYEVVPGITSAFAVPAYNGIPVTHRDFTSSVHIITGHKRKGKEYDIDFESLVRTKGTLIFLMGITSLGTVMRGLLQAGLDPSTPAAVLEKGTTAAQRRILATAASLEEEVKKAGVGTPAVIVVGDVCRLAGSFDWYEKRPLAGKKILVTRPRQHSSEVAARLRKNGAEVLELPSVETVPIAPNERLLQCIEEGIGTERKYDWIVFTSPTGVQVFMDALLKERDIRSLCGSEIAAVGQGSAKALLRYGVRADFVPSVYDGDTLGRELKEHILKEQVHKKTAESMRILIPRASAGNQTLVEELQQIRGIRIDDVPTYDTVCRAAGVINEREEIERGEVDYAVFTSASTVKGFAEVMTGLDLSRVKAICIGRQTKAAADFCGMKTRMAEKATMDAVVEQTIQAAAEGW